MLLETGPKAPELFSVLTARPLDDLPKPDAPYYVVDGKSYLVHRNTRFGRVLARTERPSNVHTYEQNGYFWKSVPKIPLPLLIEIRALFATVFEKHHSEAAVLLTVHDDTGEWDYLVPDQQVGYGSVDYKYEPSLIPTDQSVVGTIHSHCDFGAFHSGTDETDAAKHDGIHLTMGHVDDDKFEIAAMVAFNGLSWKIEQTDFTELTDEDLLSVHVPLTPAPERPAYFDTLLERIKTEPPRQQWTYNHNPNALSEWTDLDNEGWWDYGRRAPATTSTPNSYTPSPNKLRSGPAWPKHNEVPKGVETTLGRFGFDWPQPYHFSADDATMLQQVEHDLARLDAMLFHRGYRFDASVSKGAQEFVYIGDPASSFFENCEFAGCEHQCGL